MLKIHVYDYIFYYIHSTNIFLNEPRNIMKFEDEIKQAEHINIIEHLCQ